MKKVLSIFLVLVMIATLSCTAFAAGGIVTAGKTYRVEINEIDGSETYTFIAPSDGVYVLKSEALSDYAFIGADVYNGLNLVTSTTIFSALDSEDNQLFTDGYDLSSTECYFCAERGRLITIKFSDASGMIDIMGSFGESLDIERDDFIPASVKFVVEKADIQEVKLGGTYTVEGGEEMFLFAPDKDGNYNFRSQSDYPVDPSILVTRSDGTMEENDDNGYENDYNFDLTTDFKAGKVYLIECYNYNYNDDSTRSYTFTVSDGSDIKADYLDTESRIYVPVGEEMITYIDVVPTGACVDVNSFNVSCADHSVANAYISNGELYINGINVGKTTVTVEDPISGATAEITVIVYPQSVQALFNVIEIFTSMIYNFVEYLFSLITSYLPF